VILVDYFRSTLRITIRKTIDTMIATHCIEDKHYLLRASLNCRTPASYAALMTAA